jgi:AcrR family transcriptional regulator
MTTPDRPRRGRPRDPQIEGRVFDAVMQVFWETGWSAFTLEAVARRAGVGREALYRRWPSKEVLLLQALEARGPLADPIDTGSLRSDLVELAARMLTEFRGQGGLVALRVALDARVYPDLLDQLTTSAQAQRIAAARDIFTRGRRRGELPERADTNELLEMLTGAVMSHVLYSYRSTDMTDPGADRRYVGRIVDLTLHAATLS